MSHVMIHAEIQLHSHFMPKHPIGVLHHGITPPTRPTTILALNSTLCHTDGNSLSVFYFHFKFFGIDYFPFDQGIRAYIFQNVIDLLKTL